MKSCRIHVREGRSPRRPIRVGCRSALSRCASRWIVAVAQAGRGSSHDAWEVLSSEQIRQAGETMDIIRFMRLGLRGSAQLCDHQLDMSLPYRSERHDLRPVPAHLVMRRASSGLRAVGGDGGADLAARLGTVLPAVRHVLLCRWRARPLTGSGYLDFGILINGIRDCR